jgi:HTH-type transcriptional regulator / antitoxin MqsA
MRRNPREYPDTMTSPESGRPMVRGEKMVSFNIQGKPFQYRQPGWWCSLEDPNDTEGQLVDDDNLIAEMARRTAEAMVNGEQFTPLLIRAIRLLCKLSQREAGELFGTGEKSFEKYESGQIRPSEPTKRLLRLAMTHPAMFNTRKRKAIEMPVEMDSRLVRHTIHEAHLDRFYGPLFQHRQSKND